MKVTGRHIAAALCVALLDMAALLASPYDPGLSFKSLTKKDGLPHMSVMAIERDSEGYMWFATRGGLCRYDGVEFVVFNESNSNIPDNYVTRLLSDRDGSLWVGTINGLSRMDISTGRMRRFEQLHGAVRSMTRDQNGRIWISNANSLFRYDSEADSLSSVRIPFAAQCLTALKDTSLLLAGTADGLYTLDKNSGSMTPVPSFPAGMNIQAIVAGHHAEYWVGTQSDGLYRLDRDLQITDHLTSPTINHDYIRALAADRSGNILVGTYDGLNVIRVDEGDIRSYRLGTGYLEDALSFFSIVSLCCCPDGTVWVGSYVGGVNYANPYMESFLQKENPGSKLDGIIGNVGPIAVGEDGLWIGMEGDGLLFRSLSGRYERVPVSGVSGSYRSNIVSSLCRNAGTLWIGFCDGMAARIDESSRRTLEVREIARDCPVMAISMDADGTVYFGTWGSDGTGDLHALERDGRIRTGFSFEESKKPSFHNITSIISSDDGTLYISERDGGIVKYDCHTGEKISSSLVAPGGKYSTANVYGLIRESNGDIFAVTHRGGLVRVSPDLEITGSWSVRQGLPSHVAHSTVTDDEGIVWVATPDAVSCVDTATSEIRTWSLATEGEFNRRSAVLFGSEIWMGAGKDIIHFNPKFRKSFHSAEPPHIIAVNADGQSMERGKEARFKSLTHLSVYFRSLDYSEGQAMTYGYCVDGLDSKWIPIGTSPRVNMASFRPGRYVFRTKAFSGPEDIDGTEGESFSFRVLVPLWRRWWMIVIYMAVISFSIWAAMLWRKAKTDLDREREELRSICESLTVNAPEANGSSSDAEFMKKVYSCINAHIDDQSLSIDRMCTEVGVSRTGLYYKVKKTTGLSPMDLVRKVRLDVASKLLLSGNSSVTDVAAKVGFSSASYFSTAFRTAFGMSPRDYVNDKNKLNH